VAVNLVIKLSRATPTRLACGARAIASVHQIVSHFVRATAEAPTLAAA
jgi:hypothetical protein